MNLSRVTFLALITSASVPGLARAASNAKAAFIKSCDESISIARLAGAPYKFKGKHVDLHGIVGSPADNGSSFNLADDDNNVVVAIHDARQLEAGQRVRVLGVVGDGQEYSLQNGGSTTAATVYVRFME